MTNLASLREKRLKLLESSSKKKSLSELTLKNTFKSLPKSAQLANPEKPNSFQLL
jgi:hypothetical protein